LKTQSEGERREKGKEVGSTSIPFSHSPLIGYITLLNSIGLNLNILFILPFYYISSFYYIMDIGLYRANKSTMSDHMIGIFPAPNLRAGDPLISLGVGRLIRGVLLLVYLVKTAIGRPQAILF
jgi:hypothetical protein